MAVRAPLHVDESLAPRPRCFFSSASYSRIQPAIPARPDRRRIHIRNVPRKIAAAESKSAATVQPVRQVAHLRHERANRLLIDARIFGRPVIFVAETPQNDRTDGCNADRSSSSACPSPFCCHVRAADAAAAPRHLLPHQQAELIAQLQHQPRLLIVRRAG